MGHDSPVTPEIRNAVFARDREAVFDVMMEMGFTTRWLNDRVEATGLFGTAPVCPAVIMDVAQYGLCWGRWTLDHIPDAWTMKMGMVIRGVRRGKRPDSDLAHLISLCEGHCEAGMKAGYQWNTAHRPAIRKYLEEHA